MHTSVIGLTAQLHEHIRQSDHRTFTCTHEVQVNVQWPECLTCAYICAESYTLCSLHISCTFPSHGSLPIYMNILDSRISARLHAHIRCMRDPSVWRVHVNVQWIRQLTNCTFSCTHQSLGALPNYMNTSGCRITARLYAHTKCL